MTPVFSLVAALAAAQSVATPPAPAQAPPPPAEAAQSQQGVTVYGADFFAGANVSTRSQKIIAN